MRKQGFSFRSNALSKSMFLRAIGGMLRGRSERNTNAAVLRIAQFFEVSPERIFLFGAGRMSVYTVLKALRLNETDEVIVAGYTCVVLTNAVKFAGCAIRYVDIEKNTFNMNTEALIAAVTERTKAIIVPHNFGIPYDHIDAVKTRFPAVVIIEDVAHSFGSQLPDGRFCGTAGDVGFFSFEYSKPLSTGQGGLLIVNNPALTESIHDEYKLLTVTPRAGWLRMLLTLAAYNLCYTKATSFFQTNAIRILRYTGLLYSTSQKEINGLLPDHYPVKMSPVLGSLLLPQMERIDATNAAKREIAEACHRFFSAYADLEHVHVSGQVLIRYPILFKAEVSLDKIAAIRRDAQKKGYIFGEWFNDVVHPAGSYRYGYSQGDCPVGEHVAKRILNLPINAFATVTEGDLKELGEIFKAHGIN